MEETAIMFVADDTKDPSISPAQQQLPTNIRILQLLLQLSQQQLVTSQLLLSLQQSNHDQQRDIMQKQQAIVSFIQRRPEHQSPVCGTQQHHQHHRHEYPQRECLQPHEEQQQQQESRSSSSTKGPQSAVDRSACSSSRGSCTEGRVKKDSKPVHIPVLHSTHSFIVGKVECTDVILGTSMNHVQHASHVSPPDDVTLVQHTTQVNPINSKAHYLISRWTRTSTASSLQRPVQHKKSRGERKNALEAEWLTHRSTINGSAYFGLRIGLLRTDSMSERSRRKHSKQKRPHPTRPPEPVYHQVSMYQPMQSRMREGLLLSFQPAGWTKAVHIERAVTSSHHKHTNIHGIKYTGTEQQSAKLIVVVNSIGPAKILDPSSLSSSPSSHIFRALLWNSSTDALRVFEDRIQ